MKTKLLLIILIPLFIGCNIFKKNDTVVVEEEVVEDVVLSDYESGDEIFRVVETPPKYVGGDEARMKFLQNNLKYPNSAKEANICGSVFVTFVVEKDGSLTDIRILRGIGGGCDEEVIRVVKLMPNWKPGLQRGKAVRVQYNMPIKFTL